MNKNCDFCTDIRIIEPAKGIAFAHPEKYPEKAAWLQDKKEKRKMIMNVGGCLMDVSFCPICGYKFTDEDYEELSK